MWRKIVMLVVMLTLLPGGAVAAPAMAEEAASSNHVMESHHEGHHTTAAVPDESCASSTDQHCHACANGCDHMAGHCACSHAALIVTITLSAAVSGIATTLPHYSMAVPAIAPLPPDRPPRSA